MDTSNELKTMLGKLTVVIALAAVVSSPDALEAQRRSVALDVSAGVTTGSGGMYDHLESFAAAVSATTLLSGSVSRGVIGRVTVGVPIPTGRDLDCVVRDAEGGCAPDFPTFLSVGASIGFARAADSGAGLEAVTGPAILLAPDGPARYGLLGSFDLLTPRLGRVAAIISLKGGLLLRHAEEHLWMRGIQAGIRIR